MSTKSWKMAAELASATARRTRISRTGPQLFAQLAGDLKWSREEIEEWTITSVLQQRFGIG